MMETTKLILVGAALAGLLAACGENHTPVSSQEEGPVVVAMQPAPGTSYVAADQAFTAEFSEAMDVASVEAAYRVVAGDRTVQGDYTWNQEGTTMAFGPAAPLAAGQQIEVQWGSGMRSRHGRPLRTADGADQPGFAFGCQVYAAPGPYATGGEQIYFTGTSPSGEPITFTMGAGFTSSMPGYAAATGQWSSTGRFGGMMGGRMMGGGMMSGGMMGGGMMGGGSAYGMSCATCHGPDGSGGRYLAMGTVETPDIRYATLTAAGDAADHEHTPFTDQDILRAVREGVEPDGEALDPFMPRWQMSDADAAALLEFLRSL